MASLPDAQHVYLDALHKRAAELFDDEALAVFYRDEPESHVFSAHDEEGAYDDAEEYAATVRAVGERDLADKIRYWERAIESA